MKTKVARFERPGQFDSLAFVELSLPEIGRNEVEIEVDAAALNFKDVLLALGLMPASDGAAGFGFECAGLVSRAGSQTTGFSPGDAVVAIGSGCLSTVVRVDAATVCRRPQYLSSLQAVTMPIAFVTASYALEDLAHLRPSDRILIHAASGGVGLAAVQLARQTGAEIFATAGSDEKRQYLRSLGIEHVMNSRTASFADEILAATNGNGVDVILNSLSGDLMQRSLDVLAPHGRFVELGARDAIAGNTIALSAFRRGASFCSVGYDGPIPGLGARLAKVMEGASKGEIQPLPASVYGLAEAGDAFALLAAARHIGKVVVAVNRRAEVKPDTLLSPAEGARLFEIFLSSGHTNIAVSKVALSERLASAGASKTRRGEAPAVSLNRHPRPLLDAKFIAPRTATELKIAAVWQRHFELESVGVHDDFFDLGGDSLLAVQVVHSMRASLQADVPTHLLLENPTIVQLAQCIDTAASNVSVSRHLVHLAKGPAEATPIFLVHPIGGHVYFYLPMAKQLAEAAPVYGLQAQGVDGEAPPLETIEDMARSYIAAMRTVQPIGPYRIGGSSFGGTVCFEMARQLTEAGDELELLALIDSPTPSSLTSFFRSDAEILAYLLARGDSPDSHLRQLSAMSEDEMLGYFLVHGGAGVQLAPSATVESVRHFLSLFRTNYTALAKYQPRRSPVSALFFYASEHDTFNTHGFASAWNPFVQHMELIAVRGNHTSMNLPPNCNCITQRILAALEAGQHQTQGAQA